jgi:serine/threonine-protein kinase HipA
MAGKTKNIAVYADWDSLGGPLKLGTLRAHAGAGREVFEFEYEVAALANPQVLDLRLDPEVGPYAGRQFPGKESANFGVFLDSCPDRWGRLLMRRRLERAQRAGLAPRNQRLTESDYLLGVHDLYRVGALRFRLNDAGPYLADEANGAAPPFVRLRELEQASLALERDEGNDSAGVDEWLRLLIAPGGSLGGARPKASVVDTNGRLWIAKFPSVRDEFDVGAWEIIVYTLARGCGIRVANARAQKFGSKFHTYLTERFDRTPAGTRLHFASAMTLTGRADGDDASTGASYLELARVLIDHGAQTNVDLQELWTRIVFNMCVSNTDDHLRNHGFILEPNRGWVLSEAFDMNPVPNGGGLKLNVSEDDNAQDLGLALFVAPTFRVGNAQAHGIVDKVKKIVRQWPVLASNLKLSAQQQEQMGPAFALVED